MSGWLMRTDLLLKGLGIVCLFLVACEPAPALDSSTMPDSAIVPMPDPVPDVGMSDPQDATGLNTDADLETEQVRSINSILPSRGPLTGGGRIRVVGQGFIEGVGVTIAGQTCSDLELESENHLRCSIPVGRAAGDVNVVVRWPDTHLREVLDDGFTYFQPLTIFDSTPDHGPSAGGYLMVLRGQGIMSGTTVHFGETRAMVEDINEQETRMLVRVPAGEPGSVEVEIQNLNGQVILPSPFTWEEQLMVEDIAPLSGSVAGGDLIRISGEGLREDSEVRFGGQLGEVVSSELERRLLRVRTPAAQAPGPVEVAVSNENGEWRQAQAFLYYAPGGEGLEIHGIAPQRIPTVGGQFAIAGSGFDETTRVEVDQRPVPCDVQNANLLNCTAVPHDIGFATVRVRMDDVEIESVDALEFFDRVQVFELEPRRGSISGGTLVHVHGEGFAEWTELRFEDSLLEIVELVDSTQLIARTPPRGASIVDLRADNQSDSAVLPGAFEYFDPTSEFGGVWGDPIENTINVIVTEYPAMTPLAGAGVVVASLATGQSWRLVADEQGFVTVSDPELELPVSVTARSPGFLTQTFERVTNENLTILMFPESPPSSGDGGEQEPIEPATIRGNLSGLNGLEKPVQDDLVLVAFIEQTVPYIPDALDGEWRHPRGIGPLVEDGPFELVTGPTECALVAIAGYMPREIKESYEDGALSYDAVREALQPTHIGFVRFLSANEGDVLEDIEIRLDVPLNETVAIDFENPAGGVPLQRPGFQATPWLSLGVDGFYDMRITAYSRTLQTSLHGLPRIADLPDPEAGIFWDAWNIPSSTFGELGQGVSVGRKGASQFSWTYAFDQEDDAAVSIGPFVTAAHFGRNAVHHRPGQSTRIRWTNLGGVNPMRPPEPADIHSVQTYMPDGEIWLHFVPGAANELQLWAADDDPPGLQEFGGRLGIQMLVFSMLRSEFDFEDFTYFDTQLSDNRALSMTYASF